MKAVKINHIGIVEKSIEASLKFYSETLGLKLEGEKAVKEQKVKTAFLHPRDSFGTLVELCEKI